MPWNFASSRMSGSRSNGPSAVFRTISTGWSAANPNNSAVIAWSAPLGTLMVPGLTSIRYGTAASTLRDNTSSADNACRRYAGPSHNSAIAPSTTSTVAPA